MVMMLQMGHDVVECVGSSYTSWIPFPYLTPVISDNMTLQLLEEPDTLW